MYGGNQGKRGGLMGIDRHVYLFMPAFDRSLFVFIAVFCNKATLFVYRITQFCNCACRKASFLFFRYSVLNKCFVNK